jgi:hypothetical protein
MTVDFVGVDFSGDAHQWRKGVRSPSVWIAHLSDDEIPTVTSLVPVQALPGNGDPFLRLARLLGDGAFAAAAIDAPFSVPASFLPDGGWRSLVALNDALPLVGRPFPRADHFLSCLPFKAHGKPLRATEQQWRTHGLNVRSAVWWQPRGGAPLTTACLKLIAVAGHPPCSPWHPVHNGMLVEAYPAAQLHRWGLPYQGYNGHKGADVRNRIVDACVRASADALDAVLAAFGAMAARRGTALARGDDWSIEEGMIAVHP